MGVKAEIAETVTQVASTRLTNSLGITTFLAGVWNELGFAGMTIDKFAILSGAIITILVGIVTMYVKLSESRKRKQLFDLAMKRYSATGDVGDIPKELLNGSKD